MVSRKYLLWSLVLVLLLAAVACNLPMLNNAGEQAEVQESAANNNAAAQQPATNAEPESESESPPETPTQTSAPPTAEPAEEAEAAALPEFNLADPCSIVPADVAETVLGQAVEPIPGPGVCVYSNGMASITVTVLLGEEAKNNLVGQILQMEGDCSMSFSYSSDDPEPTLLPNEAAPYLVMPMDELMGNLLSKQEACTGNRIEILDEYGPGVYLMPITLLMPGGQVSIAMEEYTLTIQYVDMEQELEASVETARQILEMIAAQ